MYNTNPIKCRVFVECLSHVKRVSVECCVLDTRQTLDTQWHWRYSEQYIKSQEHQGWIFGKHDDLYL